MTISHKIKLAVHPGLKPLISDRCFVFNQDPAHLSRSESQVVLSHFQLLNDTELYKDFVKDNFPNFGSKVNIEQLIEILASKDPAQTITVKSAYENARRESSNGFNILRGYTTLKPVIDLKNCYYYAHGKPSNQKLANISDGNTFCSSLGAPNPGYNVFFKNDAHVQTFLELLRSGKFFSQWSIWTLSLSSEMLLLIQLRLRFANSNVNSLKLLFIKPFLIFSKHLFQAFCWILA